MALVKNDFLVSRLGTEFSPVSRDSILSGEDDFRIRSQVHHSESNISDDNYDDDDDDDEDDDDGSHEDVDSGASSDNFDLSELGEIGAEFCQLGNQNCSLPFELYDLPDLTGVLSLDTWNNCLTEDERFSLTEYLPDMDRETFIYTLKELFAGSNFHFGSPLTELFTQLKGGLCDPGVSIYRRGLNFFEKRRHYHLLRKYQNSLVSSIFQIKDAWENCGAYSIEERLRLLNILRSKRNFMYEGDDRLRWDTYLSAKEESIDGFWTKSVKDGKLSTNSLDVSSQGRALTLEPAKYWQQSSKGILAVADPRAGSANPHTAPVARFPISRSNSLEIKFRPAVSLSPFLQESAYRISGHVRADDNDNGEQTYKRGIHKSRAITMSKVNSLELTNRRDCLKKYDSVIPGGLAEDTTNIIGVPYTADDEKFQYYSKKRNAKIIMDMTGKAENDRSFESGTRAKYPKKVHISSIQDDVHHANEWDHDFLSKGGQIDESAGNQPLQHGRSQEADHQVKFDDWNLRSKKWKMGEEFKTGKVSAALDSKVTSCKASSCFVNDSGFQSDHRARTSEGKIRRTTALNGGLKREDTRGSQGFTWSEETEPDSSEHVDKDKSINHLTRQLGYQSSMSLGGMSTYIMSANDPKKVDDLGGKIKNEYGQVLDGACTSVKVCGLGERSHMPEIEIYSSKGKKRAKISEPSYMHDQANQNLDKVSSDSANLSNDHKHIYKSLKSDQMRDDLSERSKVPLLKTYSERKLKGKVDLDCSVPGSNYVRDYARCILDMEDLHVRQIVGDNQVHTGVSGKKGQMTELYATEADPHEKSVITLPEYSSVTWKQKGKVDVMYLDGSGVPDYLQSGFQQPIDEPNFAKKRVKTQGDLEASYSPALTSDALNPETGITDIEPETKPLKKQFTLIVPSIHTGFSFSIVHLLTAVRMAMITVHAEDTSDVGKHIEKSDEREKPKKEGHEIKREVADGAILSHEKLDSNGSEHIEPIFFPLLTIQEVVDRVRSNPMDPCILETQEPLQDLVTGVLKIFSSKTAPLGAKGWKALVVYEKSTKSWSWIGPLSSTSDHETAEEETSADAWGVPHKMLVKLVDSFANWLKSGQETLKLIGSLPPPPVMLMSNMDEKERFKDLKTQRSLTTISPSNDEVRAYFRKEEYLRYSIPDRAFSYTATDGRKSIVAPLRRCGGKPTSKARDHFMLKPDRPPHVTILCLVRDAAARLPGSIGTRADVCTLLRDSQYVVEDVSDAQVNQVVSGALDRLHYELDPCVQFDGERRLWVYLHSDREEEDFEDDGTSSTKKWKRPRKDTGAGNDVVCQEPGDQAAAQYDPSSEFNVEPSSIEAEENAYLVYNVSRPNIDPFIDSAQGSVHESHPMGWEILQEDKIFCQENFTNEDFNDAAFSRERPVGLLSASLM